MKLWFENLSKIAENKPLATSFWRKATSESPLKAKYYDMHGSWGCGVGLPGTRALYSVWIHLTLRALWCSSSSIGISDQRAELCHMPKYAQIISLLPPLVCRSTALTWKWGLLAKLLPFKSGCEMRNKYTDSPKSTPAALQMDIMQECGRAL